MRRFTQCPRQHFSQTAEMLQQGVTNHVYPGAVFSTGDRNGELFRFCCGNRALYPDTRPMSFNTLFDMASLTKIFSTTMVVFSLFQSGKLDLTNRVGGFFDAPADKRDITLRHLLTHTGGFPAHARLDLLTKHPDDVARAILDMDLLYSPGTAVTYSCLGFILLGKICEMVGGLPLNELANRLVFQPLGLHSTDYRPICDASLSAYPSELSADCEFAATEYDSDKGHYWSGVVHDENARYLRGVSGNAGVFSNLDDCVTFALMLANHGVLPEAALRGRGETVGTRTFIQRDLFDESITDHTAQLSESRGLGFALSRSALGSLSYGHTGFTGTSLWVDTETGQYAVLLTNRVHPSRENTQLLTFRHAFHALCTEEYRVSQAK